MNIEQKTETLTKAYIHSYNLALKEVGNPNLAVQIAMAITMVINMNEPQRQPINPLNILFAQMAAKVQEQNKEEREEDDDDRVKDAAD